MALGAPAEDPIYLQPAQQTLPKTHQPLPPTGSEVENAAALKMPMQNENVKVFEQVVLKKTTAHWQAVQKPVDA